MIYRKCDYRIVHNESGGWTNRMAITNQWMAMTNQWMAMTNQITTLTQGSPAVVYIPTQFGSRRLGLYSKRLVLIGVS